MLAGSLDASYLGAGPVITAASRAPGRLRIVAGANDAGAILVARAGSGIRSVRDLDGRSVAFPGLRQHPGPRAAPRPRRTPASTPTDQGGTCAAGGQVRNADVATGFQRGQLDAAMLPEPWGTQLIARGDATLLLDADADPGGAPTRRPCSWSPSSWPASVPTWSGGLVRANCAAVGIVKRRPGSSWTSSRRSSRACRAWRPSRATLVASEARLRPTTTVEQRAIPPDRAAKRGRLPRRRRSATTSSGPVGRAAPSRAG